jgi:segregation and condensation protein B
MTVDDTTDLPETPASTIDAIPDPGRVVEAVLMVASDPVSTEELAQLLERPLEEVAALCGAMAERVAAEERGFVVVEVAGGWRLQSHPDLAPWIERWVLEGQSARLSTAALETLAIIAYKQPISRAQVAAIRGVGVDGVVRTLEQRGYITEVARDPGPGQAVLFGTTAAFLEKLGLASLAGLPPVADFVPDATVVEQLEEGLRPQPRRDDSGPAAADGDAAVDEPSGDTAPADDPESGT